MSDWGRFRRPPGPFWDKPWQQRNTVEFAEKEICAASEGLLRARSGGWDRDIKVWEKALQRACMRAITFRRKELSNGKHEQSDSAG